MLKENHSIITNKTYTSIISFYFSSKKCCIVQRNIIIYPRAQVYSPEGTGVSSRHFYTLHYIFTPYTFSQYLYTLILTTAGAPVHPGDKPPWISKYMRYMYITNTHASSFSLLFYKKCCILQRNTLIFYLKIYPKILVCRKKIILSTRGHECIHPRAQVYSPEGTSVSTRGHECIHPRIYTIIQFSLHIPSHLITTYKQLSRRCSRAPGGQAPFETGNERDIGKWAGYMYIKHTYTPWFFLLLYKKYYILQRNTTYFSF